MGVDPLADQYADQGTGNFAGNDPVNFQDPSGAYLVDGFGTVSLKEGRGQNSLYMMPGTGGPSGDLGDGGSNPWAKTSGFASHDARFAAFREARGVRQAFARALDTYENNRPTTLDSKEDQPDITVMYGGLVNTGDASLHIKPEIDGYIDNKYYKADGSYELLPGQAWNHPLDGIALASRPNEVFKVGTGAWQVGITATAKNVYFASPEMSLMHMLSPLHGWKGRSWITGRHEVRSPEHPNGDYTWDALFEQRTTPFKKQ